MVNYFTKDFYVDKVKHIFCAWFVCCTLYKNDDGKYCAEEKNIICSIQPEAGLAIIFNHHRLHEGQQLKWVVGYHSHRSALD